MSEKINYIYELFLQNPLITTDSRKCQAGSMFFALKGENFNANHFAAKALEAGCAYAVIDEPSFAVDDRYIVVNDVLQTLQTLAIHHRISMNAKVIGITGSNGKTTTKELIASVLQQKYKVLYTRGNLNNHIGVPLTLLQIRPEHQLAIIEMGANHQGEIKILSEIASPDFGIITNVGKAHLEGFGSFEGIKKTKGELYDYVSANGLGVFINADNLHLVEMAGKAGLDAEKVIHYSINRHPDQEMVTGKILQSNQFLEMECNTGSKFEVKTQLIGNYNAENILAAVTIGHFFGLKNSEIKEGIEKYIPENNRSQFLKTNKNAIVIDAYNANPTSMELALANFIQLNAEEKFVILGEMKELGDDSESEHRAIIKKLESFKAENIILVGKEFSIENNPYKTFNNTNDLVSWLKDNEITNKTIFIKGSRAVQLEQIISLL